MPPVYQGGPSLGPVLAEFQQRIRALETQQQQTLSNLQGQPIMNFGLIPGTNPPQYGIQFVNPATGQQVMFIGMTNNQPEILFSNPNTGATTMEIEPSGTIQFPGGNGTTITIDGNGLHAFNGSTEEVRVGVVDASPLIYGLAVRPPSGGQLQQVGGFVGVTTRIVNNVTNSFWADFPAPNSVSAEIGPSGQAVITISGQIITGEDGAECNVGLSIDGGTYTDWLLMGLDAQGQLTLSISFLQSGLSAGSHTFKLGYINTVGSGFSNSVGPCYMTVQPL